MDGHGITVPPSVAAALREHRKRIRDLEAVRIAIPDHIVFFDKDPQNDDWLGLHVTGTQAFTLGGFVPIQINGTDVIGGIGLTSVHDIWIGTTESSGGAGDAGDVRIGTSGGGNIIIQTPELVEVLGGIAATLSAGFATFSADATAASIIVEDRASSRPQEILAEVVYDSYAVRTPKITLRTDIFGDPASSNEIVVYGGDGGAGVYTRPGIYFNLSDSSGVVGKFEIRDVTGAPILRVDPTAAIPTFEIKTGALWTATL